MDNPVRFLLFNHLPDCRARVDKVFPGYFGLNYAHAGQIAWAMGRRGEQVLDGPVAWWTWPGPRFRYGQTGPRGWDHRYVTWRGRWANDLAGLPDIFPRDRPWQLVRDGAGFAGRMDGILRALADHDGLKALALLMDALVFLRDERAAVGPQDSRAAKLESLVDGIRRSPGGPWADAECARELGLSTPHFRRLIREVSGYPFHRFVLRARMLEAARRLRSGEEPIKAVAEACGSGDVYQFSRQFRSVLGQPPATYRDQSRLLDR